MTLKELIQDQALRMGIATGDMPEVDFIWRVQKAEGNEPCFGQGAGCLSLNCRWRDNCVTLDSYRENAPENELIYLKLFPNVPLEKAG